MRRERRQQHFWFISSPRLFYPTKRFPFSSFFFGSFQIRKCTKHRYHPLWLWGFGFHPLSFLTTSSLPPKQEKKVFFFFAYWPPFCVCWLFDPGCISVCVCVILWGLIDSWITGKALAIPEAFHQFTVAKTPKLLIDFQGPVGSLSLSQVHHTSGLFLRARKVLHLFLFLFLSMGLVPSVIQKIFLFPFSNLLETIKSQPYLFLSLRNDCIGIIFFSFF